MRFSRPSIDHVDLLNVGVSDHHIATVAGDLNLADMLERLHASLTSVGEDDHHPKGHTAASHTDQASTGAELQTLTNNSDAFGLHRHDRYNEQSSGTWTPVVTFGGLSSGITYTTQSGEWHQWGDVMFITCRIAMSNIGNRSGAALITGLPATPAGLSSASGIGFTNGITFADMITIGLEGARLALRQTTKAGIRTNLTDANFSNGCEFEAGAVFSL